MNSDCFKNGNLIVLVKSLSLGLRGVFLATLLLLGLTAVPSRAAVLLNQDFNSSDGGFTVDTPLPYDGPWVYNPPTGSWTEAGQAVENMHPNTSTLLSPAITVPQAGPVQLTFVHRYSFEQGNWDGGQTRISVNGGAFTAVPLAAFTQNGYSGGVLPTSASVLAGQMAFVLDSPNFATSFITSICTLGSFQAGDSIRVAFMAANDTNTRGNLQPNWEIDSLTVSTLLGPPTLNCPTNVVAECSGGLTPVTFTVSASDDNGPVAVVCVPPSGSGFRLGTTNVTCFAANSAGTNSCTFAVTVQDTTPPQVNCPTNITQASANGTNAIVTYVAGASDACGLASFNCQPPSGSAFPVGTTTVSCMAVDVASHTNVCSFEVTVTFTITNQCPVASNLSTNVAQDSSASFQLPGSDPDGGPLQFGVSQPAAHGTVAVQSATGSATYSPVSGYCGPDSFKYTVNDGICTNVVEATVSITVNCANQCPVASNLVVSVAMNSSASFQLPAADPNNDALQYTVTAPPTHGAVVVQTATGSATYSPSSGYCGPDSFKYSVSDGICTNRVEATVSITVNCTNQCPVASNLVVSVALNSSVSFQLPAADPDGNTLQYNVTAPPTHGTVVVQVTTGASTYTPNPTYCGPDSFKFRVTDGQCQSAEATVSIAVNCSNQCPTAVAAVSPTMPVGCVGVSNVVVAADNVAACVVLNGNGSSDPNGDALTYSWTVDGLFNVRMDGAQDGGDPRMGSGSGTVALSGNKLTIDITFSGLTTNATAAHIHGPAAPGVNAAVLYPLNSITTLGGTAGTIHGSVTLTDGTGGFTVAQQLEQLRAGLWYINIHDAKFPGGEIRGQVLPGAQGATANKCLPIGTHEVCLTVSDGQCSDTKCITVEVITPCNAVGALIVGIESSSLPRNRQRPLTATLRAACASFDRHDTGTGEEQLEAFQNKVRAQVEPDDPALAQHLTGCAQAIINSLGDY